MKGAADYWPLLLTTDYNLLGSKVHVYPPPLYGDPPILTSPHPRIYAHSYTAHFSTFSAQSVAHLCCAHLGAVIT